MKKLLLIVMAFAIGGWAVPKPMESIENYNVLMVHGAYGHEKGFSADTNLSEAYTFGTMLENGATLGAYDNNKRITKWFSKNAFEEADIDKKRNATNSFVYNWRSFSNPANTSLNNAYELGYRMWNKDKTFGKRRALVEEAQEVKAVYDTLNGQDALEMIRQNPDLYHQLASRYILVGHSMGGVVSREYVQGNFYNGDVDKIITLDSPHEGTGALNMQIKNEAQGDLFSEKMISSLGTGAITTELLAIPLILFCKTELCYNLGLILGLVGGTGLNMLDVGATRLFSREDYYETDSLVHYVDPNQRGYNTIDSLNNLAYEADSLPMFRIMASEHSMTFTDPSMVHDNAALNVVFSMIPDNLFFCVANAVQQFLGTGDLSARIVNTIVSAVTGLMGIPMTENGSSLVSENSGYGVNIDVLNDPLVDIKKRRYNAAAMSSNDGLGGIGVALGTLSASYLAMDKFATAFAATGAAIEGAKTILSVAFWVCFIPSIPGIIAPGILDVAGSHNYPIDTEFKDWMLNDSVHVYEDFLYEKPFVNLALFDSRTADSLAKNPSASLNPSCYYGVDGGDDAHLCEIGLYGTREPLSKIDTVCDQLGNLIRFDTTLVTSGVDDEGNPFYYGSFKKDDFSAFKKGQFRFKAESDWYKVGVKMDRWDRVDGLKPDGSENPGGVPIRHVDRFAVPDVVVDGFIEKYSFVVDDLMPHRMRQIKMTFNSNEEVAWECDITKAEDDPRACAVYMRRVGGEWNGPVKNIGDSGYVAHPIKKNGRFDFNAREYFVNLSDIQKDNQNTVMITMVNKIGLSNTQRFYYLFKATDNRLQPMWPQHDVVLNAIDGFGAYVSALDYQGFAVRSASDAVYRESEDNFVLDGDALPMEMVESEASGAVFSSKQKKLKPAEGHYRWVVEATVNNDAKDTSKTDSYEVNFDVDRTAPAYTLTSDATMNPDSSMFITRFKWVGANAAEAARGSDIRAMRWTLEKATDDTGKNFAKVAELPALYDLASDEFAIAWDKVPENVRKTMDDGLYRIKSYAIDYAVPNIGAYHAVNALVDSVSVNPLNESIWESVASLDLNDTTIYATFVVDRHAPEFAFRTTEAVSVSDANEFADYSATSSERKYDALRKGSPARDSSWTYISADSLLNIRYTVAEKAAGRDSAAVTIGWSFVHLADTNVIDRAGDSVWVKPQGNATGSWTEMSGMRLDDGDYSIRAALRDEAKNVRTDFVPKRVRVDRTAPQIRSAISNHLVYRDTEDYSATIVVSEKGDVNVNRTGMRCSYRVHGGADTSWHEISKAGNRLLSEDTVSFEIAKAAVDTARGIRYLETACVDAAGNVAVNTSLFHVGARFPQITYPQPDTLESDLRFIPIVGVAPFASSVDSLSSVYRLRYRVGNDTTWRTDKVSVVAANRSENVDNVSRTAQNIEGVLGYFKNEGLGDEAMVTVELAIASCESCDDWAAVATNFVVVPPRNDEEKPTAEFEITRNGNEVKTLDMNDGPVDVSLLLKGNFNNSYMVRVYAEDSLHQGIFDASADKLFRNPYYGKPVNDSLDSEIRFYELDGKYYLTWKKLENAKLKIAYDSKSFAITSDEANIALDTGTAPIDFASIIDFTKNYLADYPEWMPPAYIDKEATLDGKSGTVVIEADKAFRVYLEKNDYADTAALDIPVYFGESEKPGFYWVPKVDTLMSPTMSGWTVNPNAYGLKFSWDGIATSGGYPSGDITLYAEVTENTLDNPYVFVAEKILKMKQGEAELVVPNSLPNYIALKTADANFFASDSEKAVYVLDSMKVYFGLKNANAHVRVSILNSEKKVVKVLLDDDLKAHVGDSAYSVTWNAKNANGDMQPEGKYYVQFEVDSDASKTKTSPFNLKSKEGLLDDTPEDPKESDEPSIFVAEAKHTVDDLYRYEPYADYLVMATLSGKYLPDSLRNKLIDVKGYVEGSQNIYGFRPERFSLGIKRHRDTLEMYVVSWIHHKMVELTDCNGLGNSCDIDKNDLNLFELHSAVFDENHRSMQIVFDYGMKNKGFLEFYDSTAFLDVVACSKKWWDEFGVNEGELNKDLFDTLKQHCEWSLENVLDNADRFTLPDPGRCAEPESLLTYSESVYYPDSLFIKAAEECNEPNLLNVVFFRKKDDPWVNIYFPSSIDTCLSKYLCPQKTFESIPKNAYKDVGCTPDTSSGYLDSVCEIGSTDKKYNPNLRLFNVTFTPSGVSNRFFHKWSTITTHNSARFWTAAQFSMTLEIPDAYWNAPFGMDNLVNRTVRFDHTNQTIFNENENDGYWNSVKRNPIDANAANYFDGNVWKFNQKYGLLTPYEVQRLIFYPIDVFSAGANIFRFDDESEKFMYPSRFELKFYGADDTTHHFEAKVVGDLLYPTLDDPKANLECETDKSKLILKTGASHQCQVKMSSLSREVFTTPVFKHDSVFFYVGMNRVWTQADDGHRVKISYPATKDWRNSVDDSCDDNAGWKYLKKIAEGKDSCYKYYGSGSRVHFFFSDYGKNDSLWMNYFVTDSGHYFRNLVNSTDYYYRPFFVDSMLTDLKDSLKGQDFLLRYRFSPENYESDKFFISLDSLTKLKEEYAGANVDISHIEIDATVFEKDSVVYDSENMRLYVNAHPWNDTLAYRRSNDSLKKVVERSGEMVSVRDLYEYRVNPDANSCGNALYCVDFTRMPLTLDRNPWIKDYVVETASIRQIDFSMHPVLHISETRDSTDRVVSFKDTVVRRPPELVEIRARNLNPNQTYTLSFLNNSTYYSISDSIKIDSNCVKYSDGSCHLTWFNTNRLQGHTQFLLTWGENGNSTNALHFNMYVGSNVKPNELGVVSSMFDELNLTLPQGSIDTAKDFTLRTVDVKDYAFDVYNNLPITGPIMEVLPSMTFPDTNNLPRIQMKISREEMDAMHVTPSTIRLYKVDFTSKKFVPLENALYGFLDSKGAPVMNGQNTLSCNGKTDSDTRCTGDFDWSYLLISAETRTFSVFVALDSAVAEMPVFGFEIIPEVAATAERIVNVNGISDYVLYVDDDASLKDVGDSTPAKKLAFTLDANGYAHVALPERGHGIDTNYVLVVATYRDSTGAVRESPAAPAVGRALTVNAEFACHVPADSLWLGLDNGYMAYGAACTHPGHGTVSLYRDGKLAAEVEGEIPDTLVYDGFKVTGASKMGKIPSGVYESRYVGVSALGMDLQMAGPLVYTDSARPVVRDFGVEESADILDRVFTVTANVTDSESGVAAVVVKPVFGTDSLRSEIVHPDSLGNVKAMVRLTRKRLNECSGCKLTLYFSAEDYGHNHSDARYVSDKLYPYPADVALWYPSYEGVGSVAHEYLGTGHDLRLDSMSGPWQSDVGLYFGNVNDRAYGVDSVKFGASPAYSFEARVKRGNVQQMMMKRVLGFSGRNGLNMELQLNSLGDVQLVEGSSEWLAKGLLPGAKTWYHLVVTVDSAEVKFYVDGRLAQSQPVGDALAGAERELDGKFSVGRLETLGFIGNIADVRMYRGALTGEQVAALWMPIADDEEALPQSIVVAMDDFSDVNGLDRQFSCSVAGNSYFVSKQDGASFKMSAYAENAGRFEVVLYARSATLKSAKVSVVEGSSTRNGTVALSNVWRPVTVSGALLDLKAGVHAVTLKLPAGVQVGGVAFVTEAYPASAIAWGRNASGGAEVAGAVANKVKTYVRYEGYPETTTLRPRIRMKNISGETIDGFSIRYYFRGEDASSANAVPYWPDRPESMPAVHSESARVGYVEWDFYNTQIPVNGMPFNGDGPHFGLYDTNDNDSWNAIDDPSFVDVESGSVANVDGYFEDAGIIVLDRENNLIGGACVEVEDEISEVRRVRVFAADVNNDVRSSEIQAKVENVGNVPLTSYELRYYFRLEGGLAPEFDVYDGGNCNADLAQSAQMTYYGGNLWGVSMRCERTLNVGKTWANPLKINLHVTDWMPVWNAADDPSHEGLSYTFAEAPGFCAYDSTGALIFGKEPDLGAARSVAGGVLDDSDGGSDNAAADSEPVVDYGYKAPDYSIPVARTDDGLVLTLNGYVYVELDLVNAVGMPVRSVFRGSLAPGEQHVHVDWKGIDLKRTYLVLRVNGEIKSTKLLSLM